jgi:hypothetical protein
MNNNCCVNDTFIIGTNASSACTISHNVINSCDFETSITLNEDIVIDSSLVPDEDLTLDLGTSFKRFRNINLISGSSVVWNSSVSITTPTLILGYDDEGNFREITANSSVIQNDNLLGGGY